MRSFALVLGILLAGLVSSARADQRFTPIAEKLIAAINADDQKTIQDMFGPQMRQALPADKARIAFTQFQQARGKMLTAGEPRITGSVAVIPVACERGGWNLTLTLGPADEILGIYFRDPTPETPVPERNSMTMRLPFDGEWTIFWGGATEAQNAHASVVNQRRALDIIMTDPLGRASAGDASKNESYYCYGQPILAPADGDVITVIDGVPDNKPGSMNPYSALGNVVMMKLAENQYAVLAHLIPGSPTVKVGQTVKAGQVLGKCGNSGNSSMAHLHFHLQNTAVIQDGVGITPYFKDIKVTKNGNAAVEKDYSPVKGDRVEQPAK